MIPESRIALTPADLWRALAPGPGDDLARLEQAYAGHFGFSQAILFPQGRSAIYTLLTVLGRPQVPVALPAYTCAVVAHAVNAAGGALHFADSAADHFLPGAGEWARGLDPDSVLAIPTPMYGYPLAEDCIAAIRQRTPKAFVLLDEAQSFSGAQMREADGALLSLGLGKTLSALAGGVLLLRDTGLAQRVRVARDARCRPVSPGQTARMAAMALAAWMILREPAFSLARGIGQIVPGLSYARVAQHDPEEVAVPAGSIAMPSGFQARLGLALLGRLKTIVDDRRRIGGLYQRKLTERGFRSFAFAATPTWVRFPLPVADRAAVTMALEQDGIQIGQFLRYSCADLPVTGGKGAQYPNSALWGRSMINLPSWFGLREAQIDGVVDALSRLRDRNPGAVAWPAP